MFSNVTQGSSADHSTVDYSLSDLSHEPQPDSKSSNISDEIISYETRILIQHVMKCYIRQPIAIAGIPGNILCCAVFLKQGLSDRINLLLFWLAVADLTNLMAQLLLMPVCYIVDPLQAANWTVITYYNIVVFNWWLTFVSGTLLLILSMDRCLSLVVPFKSARLLKYRYTVAAIVVSYLLPLMFAIFCKLAFTVRWKTDPATNHSNAYGEPTSWFPVDNNFAVNLMFYYSVVTKPVFLVTMITCCTITIVYLRRASRTRKMMRGNVTEEGKSGDNRVTIMLLVICGAFIILMIPEIGNAVTVMFIPEYHLVKKYYNVKFIHFQFIWLASCLNSAINFFPYFLLSSRFQRTLKDLCFCYMKKPKQ